MKKSERVAYLFWFYIFAVFVYVITFLIDSLETVQEFIKKWYLTIGTFLLVKCFKYDRRGKYYDIITKEVENMMCPICNEEICDHNIFVKTKCNHIYHESCLLMWISYDYINNVKQTCAVCRYDFENGEKKYVSTNTFKIKKPRRRSRKLRLHPALISLVKKSS